VKFLISIDGLQKKLTTILQQNDNSLARERNVTGPFDICPDQKSQTITDLFAFLT